MEKACQDETGIQVQLLAYTDQEYKARFPLWLKADSSPDLLYWQGGERLLVYGPPRSLNTIPPRRCNLDGRAKWASLLAPPPTGNLQQTIVIVAPTQAICDRQIQGGCQLIELCPQSALQGLVTD